MLSCVASGEILQTFCEKPSLVTGWNGIFCRGCEFEKFTHAYKT
ncbi:hypothetical protein HMPREF1054_0395 [Haemophilus paraphrohaemolyticus HK411]|uniref:Uncharacterized protein n=1 Tax=Haemophilus paraphrohaemolyticus HK411 TaxID=1095743 RepID=I2NK18_9PAST|nr:hypothetical protein HMPREF1054_0395 [Haemophilus paraphrohaemolyticus HK411]